MRGWGWLAAMALTTMAGAQPQMVTLPGKSPIVTFRIVLRAGSAADPADRPGTAALMASMLAHGGARELTYKQILDVLFPLASKVEAQVDKEMITFSGATHVDNLEEFYHVFRQMLLEPGWRPDDFTRLRDDAINYLRVTLRGNNDEELAKEVLYNQIYAGAPYGHENVGAVSSLEKITIDDLKSFYNLHFTENNLIIGIAGGYPSGFPDRVRRDFSAALEAGVREKLEPLQIPKIEGRQMAIVDKRTRSVAYSIGFPIDVRRGDPDYPALLVAKSYFGQHRMSGGVLYARMRQARGLNYGDYAYIEYFPEGMFRFEPAPNLARRSQIFQIWIRPLEPPAAVFGLRLALYEFDRLIKDGISQEGFERSRSFVQKYTNLLMKTDDARLGYAIDSIYYGIPDYSEYIHTSLAKLTREDVNRAIRKHLQSRNLWIVAVADNASDLKKKLVSGEPSPIVYNSPKPEEIVAEDKIVAKYPLDLKSVKIIPVDSVFE
jgi:zinc protease